MAVRVQRRPQGSGGQHDIHAHCIRHNCIPAYAWSLTHAGRTLAESRVGLQGASKSLVQLVTDLGNELKGSSEGKIVSIMDDFEHQIDGLGIKVVLPPNPRRGVVMSAPPSTLALLAPYPWPCTALYGNCRHGDAPYRVLTDRGKEISNSRTSSLQRQRPMPVCCCSLSHEPCTMLIVELCRCADQHARGDGRQAGGGGDPPSSRGRSGAQHHGELSCTS